MSLETTNVRFRGQSKHWLDQLLRPVPVSQFDAVTFTLTEHMRFPAAFVESIVGW
jgi:hypothetical protein